MTMATLEGHCKKVLFAEDDPVIRRIVEASIRQNFPGIDVITAADGRAALQKATENPPDVVVSDYEMPEMNGIDFLRQMREKFPNIPAILATTLVDGEQVAESVNAEFLSKPYTGSALCDRLRPYLQ